MKTVQSLKSVRSMKSVRSLFDDSDDGKEPELEEMLTIACEKYECPFSFVVRKGLQTVNFDKPMKQARTPVKYKHIGVVVKDTISADSVTDHDSQDSTILEENTIVIKAFYDIMNRLTEILLHEVKQVPRLLIQILGFIMPCYTEVTKITIKKCGIDLYSVYELGKILRFSNITNICLDDSSLPESNYAILLDKDSILSNLSLCRCHINDEVCRQIALKLHYSASGETCLSVLNLTSNHITDVGAKYLGDALRTNRRLRYLNLADNRITDEGANHIFQTLTEFPLTYDEVLNKRRRYLEYLKAKRATYYKYLSECDSKSVDEYSTFSKKSTGKRKKSSATTLKKIALPRRDGDKTKAKKIIDDSMYARAEMLAVEMTAPLIDPFSTAFVKVEDSDTYCMGNMVLCYLNLSYNNLSYMSVKNLYTTVLYQNLNKNPNQTGLMKVVIEGNCLPVTCTEVASITELLSKNFSRPFSDFGGRRKSRALGRISMLPERKK